MARPVTQPVCCRFESYSGSWKLFRTCPPHGLTRDGVVGRLRLLPKRFDREPACQPGEFGRTLVKLLQDREGFLEQSTGRKILQGGRLIAGGRGERRQHAVKLVSRFA